MAKAVEITFAIGASLAGSFAGTFGKAGQVMSSLQKQAENLQKAAGQVDSYQKMQGAIVKNAAEMYSLREQAESLNTQIAASKSRSQELSAQYRSAQQDVSRLTAEHVRNNDAYKAAQLNAKSLANQIGASKQPTAELQRQYRAAQEEARRLQGAVKQSSEALKAAQANTKRLKTEMQGAKSETRNLSSEAKALTTHADALQNRLNQDREALSRMRTELSGAGVDTRNLASEQARLTQQSQRAAEAQSRLQRSRENYENLRQQLSWQNIRGDLITSAGLAYSLYKPVSQAADFESAMARVNAVAFSGAGRDKEADAKAFQELQEQARQLGRDTQFTAVQAAQSQEMLARAGFKSNEIISAMPGLLNVAAAEGMDLANAADIAASTLRGFRLPADQSGRVADVLAQTSAASNTSISELGFSMKYVAPVAANLGVSLEQVSAMLGVMANAGIKGTESGTALRNAFLRLSQEPKAVAKALAKLGIASRDARGNMRQLPDIMTELSKKMKDMGTADKTKYLADIFGVRAVSGLMAVMNSAIDGSLDQLHQYNVEATGIFKAVADAVNAGSEKVLVSIEEMRAGLKNSRALAEGLNISPRDMGIYLGILAENGIKGNEADKTLMALFKRLKTGAGQVKKELKSLNVDPKNIKGLPDLLNAIDTAIKGMGDAQQLKTLEKIFGKMDKSSLEGIRAMVQGMGNGSFFKYNKAADKAKGVSNEMVEKLLKTLKGQLQLADSAVQGFMERTGKVLLPYVTKMVEGFTRIVNCITEIMNKYPDMADIVITSLGAIAAIKVVNTITKIGHTILTLPGAWLEVSRAARDARTITEGIGTAAGAAGGKFSGLWSIVAAHPFAALLTVLGLIIVYWEDICRLAEKAYNYMMGAQKLSEQEIKIKYADNPALMRSAMTTGTAIITQGQNKVSPTQTERISSLARTAGGRNKGGWKPHALGGIFSKPHIGLVAEAGREAIIPLEKQSRGTELWLEAGRELGLISQNTPIINNYSGANIPDVRMPEVNLLNSFSADSVNDALRLVSMNSEGKTFLQPDISLMSELGRELFSSNRNITNYSDIKSSELNRIANQNITQSYNAMPEIVNAMKLSQPIISSIAPHAEGGIFAQPHIGLIAEAGREAIIPLEKQSRGTELWLEAGRELGLISQNSPIVNNYSSASIPDVRMPEVDLRNSFSAGSVNNAMPSVINALRLVSMNSEGKTFLQPDISLMAELGRELFMSDRNITNYSDIKSSELNRIANQNITQSYNAMPEIVNALKLSQPIISSIAPHAEGGIFSQPHIGLVAEAGREAVIPLEDRSRGIPLWMAAGEEMGISFSSPSASNNLSFTFDPTVNITVNGGEPDSEQKFRGILAEVFEDLFAEFQEKMQRVAFS